jgi:hypothetical protein
MYMNIVLVITILIFATKHIQLRTTHFTHFFWPGFDGIYKEGAFMPHNCVTVSALSLVIFPSNLPKHQHTNTPTHLHSTLHSHQECAVWEVNKFPALISPSASNGSRNNFNDFFSCIAALFLS